MISERVLASGFHEFWIDLLPLLTPAFVAIFNEAYMHELIGDKNQSIAPIKPKVRMRHDLVAELAFHLAKASLEQERSVPSLLKDEPLKQGILDAAFQLIGNYEGSRPTDIILSLAEWQESEKLAHVYEVFLSTFSSRKEVTFSPRILGAGFLGLCRADLAIGQTLYEIKTVTRNIAGKDIRQLLIYLALQAATGKRRWKRGGFFNPRRAMAGSFSVDALVRQISGGRTATEVFQEIIDFLSTRDAQLDTVF